MALAVDSKQQPNTDCKLCDLKVVNVIKDSKVPVSDTEDFASNKNLRLAFSICQPEVYFHLITTETALILLP